MLLLLLHFEDDRLFSTSCQDDEKQKLQTVKSGTIWYQQTYFFTMFLNSNTEQACHSPQWNDMIIIDFWDRLCLSRRLSIWPLNKCSLQMIRVCDTIWQRIACSSSWWNPHICKIRNYYLNVFFYVCCVWFYQYCVCCDKCDNVCFFLIERKY
jgi:hypothetical protein